MLRELGIHSELWMNTVEMHHQDGLSQARLQELPPPQRLALILQVIDRYAAMISPRQSREGRSAAESAQSIIGAPESNDNPVGQTLVRLVGKYPPGTFVKLEDGKVAVVLRHSQQTDLPNVAIVLNSRGQKVSPPTLHRTEEGSPRIKQALPANAVQERISHHLILQLRTQ
ncbi:MAG: HD-GYP domain-containing protein [Comamonadaceae bacterium]|nr:MAG: HD-GYP domain-containing protein [Comamonadaceae bacterium]